jgi:phage/plasmid primase-like uncharacterized protein
MADTGYSCSEVKPSNTSRQDPFSGFYAKLKAGGYEPPGPVQVTTDQPVRMSRNRSKGKDGWYHFKLFRTAIGDDIGYGYYGDWREGDGHSEWQSVSDNAMELQDQKRFIAEREQNRRETEQAKIELRAAAAETAKAFIAGAAPAVEHLYLTTKGVKAYGVSARDGHLVVPMRNSAGDVLSYQTISNSGEKRYLKHGQKNGLYHLIGSISERVYIVEGYATGATVHELTGDAVLVAFDTSGLCPALAAFRKVYSGPVVFAADNDPSGAGEKYARAAADGDDKASVVVVEFNHGTDFNDLAAVDPDEARRQLQAQAIPVVSAIQQLSSLSVTNRLDEMLANIKNEKFIIPGMALSGQTTLFVAKPNGGKTLFLMRFLSDLVAGGDVAPKKIIYVNADDNYTGTADKGAIALELDIIMIRPAECAVTPAKVLELLIEAAEQGDAGGLIIVLDTLKKFADMMSKTGLSTVFKMFRELNAKNATVILLGHANKYPDKESGKLIHEGTADVINDVDCAYYMYNQSEKDDETQIVEFVNEKDRGDVKMRATYSYKKNAGMSYSDMMASITEVDGEDAQRLADEREKQDARKRYESVIMFMEDILKGGQLIQSAIVKAREDHPLGVEFSLAELKAALKRFDGEIWESTRDRKASNALTYALKGKAAKAYMMASKGE